MRSLANLLPGPGFKNQLGMAAQIQKYLPCKNAHLLEYRLKTGYISQAVAGQRVGISEQNWMDIENNKLIPTEEQAQAICRVIGKPIEVIFPRGIRLIWPNRIRISRYSKLLLIRAAKGMTQDKLAKLIMESLKPKSNYPGLSMNRIRTIISDLEWNLEIGHSPVNISIINKMAEILEVIPDEIFGGYSDGYNRPHQSQG